MRSFKLAKNCHSFKWLKESNSQPVLAKSQSQGHFEDYLLRGTYVFSSLLIVYSLLMLNGFMASDSNLKNQNLLAEVFRGQVVNKNQISYLPDFKAVWYDTVFFMDKVGNQMGEPLKGTIDIYSHVLSKSFVVTGDLLARVPKVLTAPPPYALAMSRSE